MKRTLRPSKKKNPPPKAPNKQMKKTVDLEKKKIVCRKKLKVNLNLFCLDLETTACTLTTSTFEFAALGTNIRLLVLVGTHTEVLDGFTAVLSTTDQDGVGTSRGTKSQLIQSQDFTTSLQDTGLGGLGNGKSSDGKLRNFQKTRVISNLTNNNQGFAFLGALG